MVVMISLLLTEPARGVQTLVLGLQNWYWLVQARARNCQVGLQSKGTIGQEGDLRLIGKSGAMYEEPGSP